MRILLIGAKWIGGWTEGTQRGLTELGYEMRVFHYDTPEAPNSANLQNKVMRYAPSPLRKMLLPAAEKMGRGWNARMNERLIETARVYKPDLTIVLKGETIEEETLASVYASSGRTISWWVDDPIAYFKIHPQVQSHLKYADAFFIFDRGRLDELESLGAKNLTYLPCCFDPAVYKRKDIADAERKRFACEVGFVATYYPERGNLIEAAQGFDTAVWGGGWKNSKAIKAHSSGALRGKSLSGDEIASMYQVALLSPNLHHSQTTDGGLNMRAFEIPAAGGFQLMDQVSGVEEHFEIGREVIIYQSLEHFRELARYYLDHADERRQIVERGWQRVHRDHAYKNRLQVMFETLKKTG